MQNPFYGPHCRLHMGQLIFLGRIDLRCRILNIHRIHAAGNLDDRCIVKSSGKLFGVDGRRSNDQFQIVSFPDQGSQNSQNKVDVQAALVGLIDNDRIIGAQETITLGFGQ